MTEATATKPATSAIAARGNLPRLHRTGQVPHYESFYLRAHRPGHYEAFWIKYTLLRRLDGRTTASTWLIYFNADLQRPQAFKETRQESDLHLEGDGHILDIGDSFIAPGQAVGAAAYEGGKASWDLSFEDGAESFFHLPHRGLYKAKLPRTKLLSPYPQTVFNGTLDVDGRSVAVDGWPGMMGHNWGAQHSERWIWLNCNEFEGEGPDTYLDAAAGKVRLGRWVTPWLPIGGVQIRGRTYLFNNIRRTLRGKVHDGYTSCEMDLRGRGARLAVRVHAPTEHFIGLVYQDPDGKAHHTLNCSMANAELTLTPRRGVPTTLVSRGGATYEIGVTETEHPVKMAPFADF